MLQVDSLLMKSVQQLTGWLKEGANLNPEISLDEGLKLAPSLMEAPEKG